MILIVVLVADELLLVKNIFVRLCGVMCSSFFVIWMLGLWVSLRNVE